LIPYKFNQELFDLLKGSDYEALKRDIKKNGIKVELHILPPNNGGKKTVICGHQRLKIAKELKIKHLRCKTVYDLNTPQMIKEYVILDNLLRRQLTPEKQAFLQFELVQIKKKPQPRNRDTGIFEPLCNNGTTDVYQEVADLTNASRRTVARSVAFVKAVKERPEEYEGKKVSVVLRKEKKKKDEKRVQEESPKLKLNGIYKTIVIDPPWETKANIAGRSGCDYAEMCIEDINTFFEEKVKEHIDDNAHIYLWTINNRLHDSFHLLEKWGFDYKTIVTWVKPSIGMGNYFRNNTEHILFAVKGKLGIKQNDIPTWFKADKSKHSVKPDKAYETIERASHPPYVDIFGRKKRDGWDILGDVE